MTFKFIKGQFLLALLALVVVTAPAIAQSVPQASAVGLVVRASGAQIGNAAASEGASIYSGDALSTADNGALLVRIGALSLELESSTSVHIYGAPYGAVVELDRGSVLYSTPGGQQNLVIVASDVRVTPVISTPDYGRVKIDDPCNVSVSSQRGEANVQAGSENRLLEQGKAYRVRAENEISYGKYLSPDADDYHRYHEHTPCAPLEMARGRAPVAAGQSRFLLVTAVAVGAGTGIAVWKALESPDRP